MSELHDRRPPSTSPCGARVARLAQVGVLVYLGARPGINQSEFARAVEVGLQGVRGTVASMIDRGCCAAAVSGVVDGVRIYGSPTTDTPCSLVSGRWSGA